MQKEQRRICLLDEMRGLAILLMVVHHFLYTLGYLFDVRFGRVWFEKLALFTPLFAGLFIVLCGISCHLSRNNWRRGLELAAFALLLSLTMWLFMPQEMIRFGILHCLAVCILLYAALAPLLRRIPAWLGLAVALLLFRLTYHAPFVDGGYIGISPALGWHLPWQWINADWGFVLGTSLSPGSDYFPLIPWLFLFLAGTFVGIFAKGGKFPAFCYRPHCRPLAFIGRHTVWVYLAHQPVIFALLWLWFKFI